MFVYFILSRSMIKNKKKVKLLPFSKKTRPKQAVMTKPFLKLFKRLKPIKYLIIKTINTSKKPKKC